MKFFMMIGIPNSGKSEMAKEIAKQENAIIIATDDLREELFNNVNNQANNDLVFRTAMQRVKQNIKNKFQDEQACQHIHGRAYLSMFATS